MSADGITLGMKQIVREIKELIEASEPGMIVVGCCQDEPVASPIGVAYGRTLADATQMDSRCRTSKI
jgi:hypothetical protein